MPAKWSPDFSCGSRPGSHHSFAHEKSGLGLLRWWEWPERGPGSGNRIELGVRLGAGTIVDEPEGFPDIDGAGPFAE
jgi:hypothetical protein